MQLFLKMLSGMANSVDAYQTEHSDLGLHFYGILSETLVTEILGHLP